jgi:hypothetical protein
MRLELEMGEEGKAQEGTDRFIKRGAERGNPGVHRPHVE